MKRKVTTFVFLIGMILPISGQQQAVDFSGFNNPNWIPSGILFENNPDFWTINPINHNHPIHFNGFTDSVGNRDIFLYLYEFFYFAAFDQPHPNLPVIPDSLSSDVYSTNPSNPIRIGLMDFSFEALSDSAIGAGWVVWDSVPPFTARIIDSIQTTDTIYTIDTTVTPHDTTFVHVFDTVIHYDKDSLAEVIFETHRLFTAATYNFNVVIDDGDSLVFILDFIDIFDDEAVSGPYQLSLDGGSNFHTISPGIPLVIYNHNLESGTHQLILRKGNTVESPRSVFSLDLTVSYGRIDYQVLNFNPVSCPSLDFSDGVGSGVASFTISGQNNGKIKKPVIIVEGLDVLNPSDEENDYASIIKGDFGFGAYFAKSFFSTSNTIGGLENPYGNSKYLYDSLLGSGYDIIYLDFQSSRTHIRKNANYLIQLIQFVNDSLELNQSGEQIAIMGLGTGGVIARVALREMEIQMCCHNTRMYASFDAPHRGFSFPIGLQAFMEDTRSHLRFRMHRNRNIRRFYENVILSPQFSELMIYNLDSDKLDLHKDFIQYLDQIGMPQGTRNFAVSNGSDQGYLQHIEFSNSNLIMPGDTIFDFSVKTYAPSSFTLSVINAINLFKDLANKDNMEWYLARGIPFIGDESVSSNQFDMYHTGPGVNSNRLDLIAHYGILTAGGAAFFIVKKTAAALILAAPAIVSLYGPPNPVSIGLFIAAIKKWSTPTLAAIATATEAALIVSSNLNKFYNNSNLVAETNPFPTLSHDNAPGGRYPVPQILENLSSKSTGKLKRPEHGFVSTLSALNIDSTNLTMNIGVSKNALIVDGIIPFEDYHSAISYEQPNNYNELHGLLTIGDSETEGNLPWFIDRLHTTRNPSIPAPQNTIVLQGGETMNYGLPSGGSTPPETRLRNMDILANGKAAVNSLDNVGLAFQQLSAPDGGSYFSVSTQAPECGGTYCKVDNDGIFQLGEFYPSAPSFSTRGQAIFLENSTLEILPGGKLVIERQSRLIIEEGAKLIIHPGAEIYLNDASAILEIKGKIELKDNAVFTFTSETPANYGHVIFNQRQWDDGGEIPVEEYWEVGENASLEFQGVGQYGKVLMECKQNFRSKDLSLIKITNGTVDIHEHITANLTANSLYLEYLRVKGHAENNHPHHGIQVWGMNHQTAHIRFNNFQDGEWGIRGYQLGEQIPLMVLQCNFTNNKNALYFNNGSFWVHSCTFDSSPEGIVSEAASGSSTVESSQFNGTHAPIVVESDVSSSLEVRGCDFDGSGTVHETAILHNTIDLRLKCSKIEDYHIGINTINASVDLSNDGGNRIYSTVFAILLDEATSIYFHNGENILAGNIIDVLGDLASTDPLVMVNHNGVDKINALDNNLQATSTGFKTHIFESGTSTLIPLHCQSFHLTPDCREPSIVMNHPFDTLIGNIPTDIYVDVEGVSVPFSLGLLQVTGDVFNNEGYEAHLYDALVDVRNIMDEVSQQVHSGSSDGTKKAFRIGFSMMFDILRKCYHYDVLQAVGADPGAPVNPYINSMNNYIDDIIGFIPSGADYDEQVAIQHIIRAHVYRLAQHHQFALYALSQVGGDISPQTEDRKEYWNCLIYWEMEMLLGNITMEDYNQQFITCGMMFSPYKTYEEEDRFAEWDEKKNREGQLSIYPNPAMDNIYVRMENIASPEDEVVITITASDGKTVLIRKEQASFLIGVNVSELSQGAYTLTVKTPYKTHNGQFLIAR